MKYFYTAAALLAATASADFCSEGSTDDNGNYYCKQVNAITYTGVGGSGSYNRVTSMDGSSGSCGSAARGYSGSLAPLDEEVSMHFRGPLTIKQFAFYAPSSDSKKRSAGRPSAHERRHGHSHAHLHKRHAHGEDEKRGLGDMVTATINGLVQTWANDYAGGAAATDAPSAPSYGSGILGGLLGGSGGSDSVSDSSAPAASSSSAATPSDYQSGEVDGGSGGSGWTRQGYYNAEKQTSDGIVFLNHNGGSGSGVFDYSFGNSLSYAGSDGSSGSSAPQTLADKTLDSEDEVIIMTDNKCSGDDCGYCRDGTVAYHGFDGPSKAFFFEFGMPDDGQTSADIYKPVNMPAIWMLNAEIPRTLQYGKEECSCWATGCGEFDIFEVLAPGDKRCKSTLHGNIAGGSSDYFARPTNGTIKAAFLLYNDNIHIKLLDDFDFGNTMGSTFVTEICQSTLEQSLSTLTSLFKLGGS